MSQVEARQRGSVGAGARAAYISQPFGYAFDFDELARLYRQGAPAEVLARVGLPGDR